MRRWAVRIVVGLAALLLVAGVGAYWYARPLLLTGTGYAAHNACALTELAGRPDPRADLPPNPLVPHLRVSTSADSADASIYGLLSRQRASYAEGYGCTLGTWKPSAPAEAVSANALTSAAAPAPDAAVTAAISKAFGDDLDGAGRTRLGTRAVVVLKDGRLVAERYADGFTPTTRQLGWSMTKSVANLLTGRLVLQGKVAVTDAGLRPEWTDDRAKITIDDLMRMTSGLSWDETYDLGTPITRMLYLEPDMSGYVASLPLAHAPGTYQQYSTGSINLLCSVLVKKAGGSADLPRQQLFAPLGLSSAVLEPDGVGNPVCGSYAWATPRDWASIGQFALQDGVWEGTRLLPEGWMASSTTVKAVATSEDEGYGAGWWVNKLPDGSLVNPSLPADLYYASGHDGQRVYVVPSAGLVIVRMGFSPGVRGAELRADQLAGDLVAALG